MPGCRPPFETAPECIARAGVESRWSLSQCRHARRSHPRQRHGHRCHHPLAFKTAPGHLATAGGVTAVTSAGHLARAAIQDSGGIHGPRADVGPTPGAATRSAPNLKGAELEPAPATPPTLRVTAAAPWCRASPRPGLATAWHGRAGRGRPRPSHLPRRDNRDNSCPRHRQRWHGPGP